MKRIYNLLGAVLMCGVSVSQAPISLTNSNMPSSGDTLRYSNAQLSSLGNYTQTGTNYSWNFSTLNFTGQGLRSFKNALSTPYAFFFFGFNEYGEKIADTLGAGPLTLTNYYNYYKKQTSPAAYLADGAGITFSSVPVPNYYSDKDELYMFPLTYPKYDSTTFKFSTSSNTLIPIKYSKTGYRVTVVDGWGTITTPYGTAGCLRVVTTQYSMDSIKNNLIPFPVGFPNYQRSYQWLTTSSKIPFLEITGNLTGGNFTPTQARYRDIPRNVSGISEREDVSGMIMYPNPVKDKLIFDFRDHENYTVAVYDLKGALVKEALNEHIGGTSTGIDVSGLKPGLYVVKVNRDKTVHFLKFIKE